jgi:hypothetical protein
MLTELNKQQINLIGKTSQKPRKIRTTAGLLTLAAVLFLAQKEGFEPSN